MILDFFSYILQSYYLFMDPRTSGINLPIPPLTLTYSNIHTCVETYVHMHVHVTHNKIQRVILTFNRHANLVVYFIFSVFGKSLIFS